MNTRASTIVVEDQPITWDYIRSCIDEFCDIKEFCTNSYEAEEAIKKHKPKLVWLDCYLGEFADDGQGIKNSGLQLAYWIKNTYPKTKIFLFTASNEPGILKQANKLGIEGIALSGKYISHKEVVVEGVKAVLKGKAWLSPEIAKHFELKSFAKVSIFEFAVVTSLLYGKNTNQIACDLDTSRKLVNNAIYRVKEKLGFSNEMPREEFLEAFKDKIKDLFDSSKYYNLTEVVSVNTIIESYLSPLVDKLKTKELSRTNLDSHKL